MKTTEERATELADRFKAQKYFDGRVNDAVANAVYEAAIIMADEQKAELIDKVISYIERMPQDLTRQEIIDGLIDIMEE